MYWYVIIFGLIVLYGFYQWTGIRSAISQSVDMIAHTVPYEQHPPSPNIKILVAGDSTAAGVGAPSAQSIAGRLGADLPAADIVNIGVSGIRLAALKENLAMHKDGNYDVLVLQIGANDVTGRTPYEDIRVELSDVLTLANTIASSTVVLTSGNIGLSPVFHFPVSSYLSERTREVRNIFMTEIAKHDNITYVDLFKERKDDVFLTDIKRYYATDLFHPSGEGYGVWYQEVGPRVMRQATST